MIGLIGKKIGMTTVFDHSGNTVAVTVVKSGPCVVTDIKTSGKNGYNSLQLGFEEKKKSRLIKPEKAKFEKLKINVPMHIKEFRLNQGADEFKIGQFLTLEIFEKDAFIDVQAVSKGKGFQGVMKKYGFKGGPDTHGSNFHRRLGSAGNNTFPGRIWKNKKMPGRMGNAVKTVQNLKIIEIDKQNNIILLKGSVPGPTNGIVFLKKAAKQRLK
ncbi:MAG TPA: 50S ribosomal protein L3 [Spirochaetia bacterium]|nr:50S ribosomal protein L3 [Spirochaetia bacterium]